MRPTKRWRETGDGNDGLSRRRWGEQWQETHQPSSKSTTCRRGFVLKISSNITWFYWLCLIIWNLKADGLLAAIPNRGYWNGSSIFSTHTEVLGWSPPDFQIA
jgi:hypothetical protein